MAAREYEPGALRPTNVLSCYLNRRRIDAYLDGVLDERARRSTEAHLAVCARCAREVEDIRRMQAALRRTSRPADPDWTAFWPGIVRGIEAARRPSPMPRRALFRPPRWAYGGALAAAVLVSVTVWQLLPDRIRPEGPVVVRSVDTGETNGTVMVYSTPEKDLTVVWVFSPD